MASRGFSSATWTIVLFAVPLVVGTAGCGTGTPGFGIGSPLPELSVEGWIGGPRPERTELDGNVVVMHAWAHW